MLNNYDINAEVGPLTAVVKTFTGIAVYDGRMTITLSKIVNNPKISGIEIFSEGDLDIVAGIEPNDVVDDVLIYPNPTDGQFTVEMSSNNQVTDLMPYIIYDLAGRIVDQSTIQDSKVIVDLSGHRKGVYIIKIGNYKTEKIFLR